MNKLFKLSALFLFLSAPSAFAGTTVCEFNDPYSGTTPGCTQSIIYSTGQNSGYTQIIRIEKDGEFLVNAHRTFPYWPSTFCDMGLSTGQDDYSLTVFDIYDSCTHYRINTQ